LERLKADLAPHVRESFLRLGVERIPMVLRFRHGVWFVEELFLDAVMEQQRMLHRPAVQHGIDL